MVVSDTTLRADDPVVRERCPADGLLVRAPASATGLHLSLGGHSIVGSGKGTGIRVVAGGREGVVIAGGSTDGHGIVAGFATGLRATGRRSLAQVSGIEFSANKRDGVALWGRNVVLVDVIADGNGRDGVHMGGRDPQLREVSAERNGRYGVRVSGTGAELEASGRANRRGNVVSDPRAKAEAR
jgi:hypothetical protein